VEDGILKKGRFGRGVLGDQLSGIGVGVNNGGGERSGMSWVGGLGWRHVHLVQRLFYSFSAWLC